MISALQAVEPGPLLEARAIAKRFGGVAALRGIDFDLRRAEVHALLGENGAGKSTLIKVLAGIHAPDAGVIKIDGEAVAIRSVAASQALGIRVIHQELSLAPNLSIAENIYLGAEPCRGGWIRRGRMRRDAADLVERLGLVEIADVRRCVGDLNVAHRQLVEIARALSAEARILVLDEPTSALSGAETEALFAALRRLRAAGTGIIYISHRLEEVLRLADRVTVLRDGRSVGVRSRSEIDERELVRWLVDRDITDHFHRPPPGTGGVVLEARGLANRRLHGVSFDLHGGEILGIAGLVGSGRSELARALFGIDSLAAGEIRIAGRRTRIRRPSDALRAGLVLVPEDRGREGLVMIQSLGFNLALPWTRKWCRGIRPNRRLRGQIIARATSELRIKAPHPGAGVSTLSGGNQQKALVGRWMEEKPLALILDEPTRGVDVGAREEMFAIVARLAAAGAGVILISSDLTEVMSLSHRVLVWRDGRIVDVVDPRRVGIEPVMALLTGAAGADSGSACA